MRIIKGTGKMSLGLLISGPVGLYHYYSPDHGIDIYLFSDHHGVRNNPKANCNGPSISIEDFIINVLKINQDKQIQVFLETTVLISGKMDKTPFLDRRLSYIQDVVRKLEVCIVPLRNTANNTGRTRNRQPQCKYSNLQIHPIDFRSDREINIWTYFITLHEGMEIKDSPAEVVRHVEKIYRALVRLHQRYPNLNPVILLVKFYDVDGLMESTSKTVDKLLWKEIMDYLQVQINKLIPGGMEELLTGLQDFLLNYNNLAIGLHDLSSFLIPYVEAETWIVEYYTWAQIFGAPSPLAAQMFSREPGSAAAPQKNILYYAGNYHTQSTSGLLKYLNFTLLERTRNSGQCLNIKNFKPIFGTKY